MGTRPPPSAILLMNAHPVTFGSLNRRKQFKTDRARFANNGVGGFTFHGLSIRQDFGSVKLGQVDFKTEYGT